MEEDCMEISANNDQDNSRLRHLMAHVVVTDNGHDYECGGRREDEAMDNRRKAASQLMTYPVVVKCLSC